MLGSQHVQRIKPTFTHLPNDLRFVLMAGVVGCHLSLDDLLERWQCVPHRSCLVYAAALVWKSTFSKLNGCHFSLSPGK